MTRNTRNNEARNYIIVALGAIVIVIALVYLMTPDDGADRIRDAAHDVQEGFEDAGEELNPNRTTGEKVGDAIEDAGEEIQDLAN